MKFSTKVASPDKARSPLGVFGVSEGRKLSAAAQALDKASGGAVAAVVSRGDMEGKAGTHRLLYGIAGFERVLLVGLGKEGALGAKEYRDAMTAAARAVLETG